jgi:signal transduction histidine kinase
LTLPPGAGELIEIQFTAPSFFAPEKLRFQYLLQPRDKTWNNLDRQRSVFLQGLRPGDYEFQLRARDAHGRWSAHPAFLSFTVQAHLWDRAGFFPALLGTAVAAVAGLAAFRVRWQGQVLSARHERKLAEERARIARDLHDDLGTALTGVALDMDLTRRQAGGDVASRLSETAANVRALVQRMREVVWAVNPACDDVVSLVTFLEEQARAILEVGGLTVRIKFPEKLPEANLELETRYQLSLGLREAFTNILRHAGAKEVAIHMELQGSMLVLELHDDGRGFEPGAVRDRRGHGLDHLRVRMSQVGGQFDIQSRLGEGTTAILCVPFRPIKKKTARS